MDLGVNLSGAEFGNSSSVVNYGYTYPSDAEIDYYASKGLDVIRLPVLWERVQPTENGPLDATQLSYIDSVVNYAASKGIKVDLDIHNYGYGYGNQVGSSGTPDSAFADLWGKLAAHFSGSSNIMFGLMNEPHDISATQWLGAANAAIAAIRAAGASQEILVPGTYWDGAESWTTTDNATVLGNGIVDPDHNFAFEVHQYLDSDDSGTHADVVSATIGVERLTAITQWAEQTGNKLFLGEFGVGTDATSLTALNNMLSYMNAHSDVWQGGTEWGGGPWWGNYMYSVEPTGLGTSTVTDKPQIGILESYVTQAGPLTITADTTGSESWSYTPGSTISFTGSFTVAQNLMIAGDPTIFVDHGQTEVFSGTIADSSASDPGILEKTGAGTLVLSGTNTFSGGTLLDEGTLDLASLHAAGTGSVTFGAGAETLVVEHGALSSAGELTNFIAGFASDGDIIDVRGIGQDAVAHFDFSTDTLTLSSASDSSTVATLHFLGDYTGDTFAAASDGLGGTEVTLAVTAVSQASTTVSDSTDRTSTNVTGHATGHDLFGNGSADQVVQSNTGGLLTMFAISPSGGLTQIGQVGSDWSVVGSGDLDGNGRSDLIMQHDVGGLHEIYSFTMGTSQVTAIAQLGSFGTDWQVDGTGDFNGDGYNDILLERSVNGTKELAVLGIQNGAVTSVNVAGVLPATYQVDGIGDMNGDGKDDILTHYDDASGRHFVELDQANYTTQSLKAVATVGTEWQALGLGDFNHDGFKDVLIERDTGAFQDLGILVNQRGQGWVFKDLGPILGKNVQIDGIGDFNGDGTADISAHYDAANGTRTNIYLEMHDAAVTAIHTTGSVGHDWMLA